MTPLPETFTALCLVVSLLGLQHGFDADHLAAIDGLTRHNTRLGRVWGRYCGLLFSAGHGAVVIVVALAIGTVLNRSTPPQWLDATGAWISIGFLYTIGALNLHRALRTAPGEVVAPAGLRSRVFARVLRAEHPLSVAGVGALFAVSFDTMSQAALFGATASHGGTGALALVLGLCFMLGMMASDGLNGLWISRLIHRADARAAFASRVLSVTIATASLGVATFNVARRLAPAVDGWSDGRELAIGLALVATIVAGYVIAMQATRSSRSA